jgi:DNA-binding IscR family transcriptional regulator
MKRDSKLSSVLHLLLHMAHGNQPRTSEELAGFLNTHPVLVRRVLAGLRERGYVGSDKGHGGGWTITCDLHDVTLHDIYEAVGSPTVFAMGNRVDHPECLVEKVVNQSLASAFDEAEVLLIERFRDVTLADLSERFNQHYATHHRGGHAHRSRKG